MALILSVTVEKVCPGAITGAGIGISAVRLIASGFMCNTQRALCLLRAIGISRQIIRSRQRHKLIEKRVFLFFIEKLAHHAAFAVVAEILVVDVAEIDRLRRARLLAG